VSGDRPELGSLAELQARVDDWIRANGGYWDEMSMLARLCEETGEVAREYNHRFGAKKKKASEAPSSVELELGDLLFILICMANQQGISLESAMSGVLEKYRIRDAGRWV
jgi:NTP pyrophosphatase (non-canonical NTP hydrolase)